MAGYDFKCSACGGTYEINKPMNEDFSEEHKNCPLCKKSQTGVRVFQGTTTFFQGSGYTKSST